MSTSKTSIEWCDRTWNVIRGCAIISPGCTNCYAMRIAHRFSAPGDPFANLTIKTRQGPKWTGEVRTVPEALGEPWRWKKPARIFVNSMSDLFHEDVPLDFIDQVWRMMHETHKRRGHTFLILTKRPERMLEALGPKGIGWYAVEAPVPNPEPGIWLGVSVENREQTKRIDVLRQTPAAVRFVSFEPLLESVAPVNLEGIHQAIIGGESGPKARRFDLDWARALIGECREYGVAPFMKQVGSNAFEGSIPLRKAEYRFFTKDRKGGAPEEWPEDLRVREYPNS